MLGWRQSLNGVDHTETDKYIAERALKSAILLADSNAEWAAHYPGDELDFRRCINRLQRLEQIQRVGMAEVWSYAENLPEPSPRDWFNSEQEYLDDIDVIGH